MLLFTISVLGTDRCTPVWSIGAAQRQRAGADLGERATRPVVQPAVLNHAGKVVLRLLLPTVRFLAPRKTFPVPSTEPMRHTRSIVSADVKLPLPKTSTAVPPVGATRKSRSDHP